MVVIFLRLWRKKAGREVGCVCLSVARSKFGGGKLIFLSSEFDRGAGALDCLMIWWPGLQGQRCGKGCRGSSLHSDGRRLDGRRLLVAALRLD
ncbi:hypothetical protein RchiOBHm_Chr5g0012501 [Rosa chinensis]|uniref:Uncharacterized protein n=1 Tax=Rosa chinensis TaxID=74649 RepID=A0A2P6Q543_ROSCH|nr:hypothetical protein RchiOBHm_Chr5g0012501 [Rosa chinensis]